MEGMLEPSLNSLHRDERETRWESPRRLSTSNRATEDDRSL